MTEHSLFSSKKNQFRKKAIVMSLLVLMVFDGIFLLLPRDWQPSYVLLASLVMMAAIFILLRIKPLSEEEKRVRPLWFLLGIANVCVALVFVLFDFSPKSTLLWMMGILAASSQLTSFALIQYLQNRKIIF